jgi:hypothetical protein
VQLAQEHDAIEDGVPFISANRRRLVAPDTRSRVVGYLATAPTAAPGFRTDGEWVWPEALAAHARSRGAAPQEQLFEHMRQRSFLIPDHVPATLLERAAGAIHGPAVPDPRPDWDWIHLGGYADQSGPADVLLRIRSREDGSVAESSYTAAGWSASQSLRSQQTKRLDRRQYVEISGREAAALNDRLCISAHAARLTRARESEPVVGTPRFARVFDGESPAGTPWFSPHRQRIPEPDRRERIAAYLSGGRLVVRATGRMPDPMDPEGGSGLPLSYRTDGVWVWQESLAHYVLTRGVAPELEFLCHLEERGHRLPDSVAPEVVPIAGAVVKSGPPPRLPRPQLSYFWLPSGTIARSRGREPGGTETLREDLRWNPASVDQVWDQARLREVAPLHRAISEEEAVNFIDARWAAGVAVPPLD